MLARINEKIFHKNKLYKNHKHFYSFYLLYRNKYVQYSLYAFDNDIIIIRFNDIQLIIC